ncbi:MAG TPA: hypothetical protein VMA36_16910 [Candidatus Limnocylindria bacterium]|jgi:hypothetical protein|nr:hypothetical protein [Candidatus Limnocylindria bacterium]
MSQWQSFAKLLGEENRLLAELNAAALKLTEALVANVPAQIEAAERRLEAQRVLHGIAYAQRYAMQKKGFRELTLRQVCAYAPPTLRRWMYGTVRQIEVRCIELRLTVANNKSLIIAGLERIARTVALIQRAGTEQTGTYRRRGVIPPPEGSVIVSRKA